MSWKNPQKYHGRYTVSEYALVKGELLKEYSATYNVSTIDSVLRYIANKNWTAERTGAYQAALAQLEPTRSAALNMLELCDDAQAAFDRLRYGGDYKRSYEEIPGKDYHVERAPNKAG